MQGNNMQISIIKQLKLLLDFLLSGCDIVILGKSNGGREMGITTADKIADYFLWSANEKGDFLSNLKLQKLVYYAQAWFLAFEDEPLFDDRIEAWIHGPAIYSLWKKYSDSKWRPINIEIKKPKYDDDRTIPHLEKITDAYGIHEASFLEKLTHQERPWINARKGLDIDEEGHSEISHEDMKKFYREFLDEK